MKPYFETSLGKLYHGDCLDVMKEMPDKSVDLVLTDPPYGVGRDKGFGGEGRGFGGKGQFRINVRQYEDTWDKERPSKECFDRLLKIGKLVMLFGGNFFADILPQGTHWIFWDKLQTMPTFGDGELIWTNSPRKSVWRRNILQLVLFTGRLAL